MKNTKEQDFYAACYALAHQQAKPNADTPESRFTIASEIAAKALTEYRSLFPKPEKVKTSKLEKYQILLKEYAKQINTISNLFPGLSLDLIVMEIKNNIGSAKFLRKIQEHNATNTIIPERDTFLAPEYPNGYDLSGLTETLKDCPELGFKTNVQDLDCDKLKGKYQ